MEEKGTDRRVGTLAERQHGVVARRQLLGQGVSVNAIEGRVKRGQLLRIHHGVYTVGTRLVSTEGRWMAAVLACDPGAVLSHRSAGQLWQLVPRSPLLPEVTRPGRHRKRSGLIAHRSTLGEDEVTEVEGIPVTGVSRTLFDLAGVLDRHGLEQALNEAEVRRLTDSLSLPALLERHPRRRGAARLRALLKRKASGLGVTRSELEERFVALLDRYAFARPRLNADIAVQGRFFKADCLWSHERLIVELDGRAVHGTAQAFEADRERDRLLVAAGWRVLRLTWQQLRDEPDAVARDLRAALGTSYP